MMNVTHLGIDVAKQIFQVHGVDACGHTVLHRRLSRTQRRTFFAPLPACLIRLEACGSAHYWARAMRALGHEVRLMAPQFVAPYRKNEKNDGHDEAAI